jgi:hypothetical protein
MNASTGAARRRPAIAWVVLVLGIGVAAGLLFVALGLTPSAPPPTGGPAPMVRPAGPLFFSGLDLVLLLALVVVYLRTYLETKARFALGLTVFLVVLFFQALVSSPALFGAFGYGPGDLGFFFLLGGILEAVALSVFLFLSLE